MKRFFCTVCGRVKRVRKYPISVSNKLAESVLARVGRCDKHGEMSQGKSGYMQTKRGA